MGIVWHDNADDIFAQHDLAGTDLRITEVRIGVLMASELYDATGAEIAPVDPAPTIFNTGFTVNRGGPVIDTALSIPRPNATRQASEIYFYAGADLLIVWANMADFIFTQTAEQTALILLIYAYEAGGVLGPITVQIPQLLPMATTAIAGISTLAENADIANPPADPKAVSTDNIDALSTHVIGQIPMATPPDDATDSAPGLVELSTDAEVLAAITGTDPPAASEQNVVTLQNLYSNRTRFGPIHRQVTAEPTPAQIAASNPGDIWLQV